MRVALVLTLTSILAVGACATPTGPMGTPSQDGTPVATGDDCAVIAAVAKEHYLFNTTDNRPPPLWVNSEDADGHPWRLQCNWSAYGLAFPQTYDPQRPPPGPALWVQFKKPRYDGQGALVETGILQGPMAGQGAECRVRSGFAGWTVSECRDTWVS